MSLVRAVISAKLVSSTKDIIFPYRLNFAVLYAKVVYVFEVVEYVALFPFIITLSPATTLKELRPVDDVMLVQVAPLSFEYDMVLVNVALELLKSIVPADRISKVSGIAE